MENYQKTPKTTNDHPETTQKLPFVAKSYQMLPFVAKSYQMLPKVTKCCQKFLYPVPGQYVSWDNMSPSCTGTICLLGQYVPFLNSKIMSNRGTFCPGDVLSRDNICPGTICPGTKCPLTPDRYFLSPANNTLLQYNTMQYRTIRDIF